jgi:hypothetical protein
MAYKEFINTNSEKKCFMMKKKAKIFCGLKMKPYL